MPIFAEKEALVEQAKQFSVERNENNDESEKDTNLNILHDQLKHLEEEKKYLDEKIHDFEHETAGLVRMFSMQQEKFEYEIKNKDNVIKITEKERKRLEEEWKTTRNELEKLKIELEEGKQIVTNLKISIQEKDEKVLNISHLHNDTEKLLNELEGKFTVSEENLEEEQSKNQILEQNFGKCKNNLEALKEENRRLQTEVDFLRVNQTISSEEKCRVKNEMEKLNRNIKCLQNEVEESQKINLELEECNVKLKQDNNDKEIEVQKLEKRDVKFQTDIENLKKEIVLVDNQKQALESKMSLVQTEIKNVERSRDKIEQEFFESHKSLKKAEDSLEQKIIENEKIQEESKVFEEVIRSLTMKNEKLSESLEKTEESLDKETKEKEKLEDAMRDLEQTISDSKNTVKQQNMHLDETKRELDSVILTKQNLFLQVEKLEDANKDLKMKVHTLTQDIEHMDSNCATKAKELEDLEQSMKEKSRIIITYEKKVEELQDHIEELLNMDGLRENELKNAREDIMNLRDKKRTVEEKHEGVTLELQDCLQELNEKEDMYKKCTENNKIQLEELSRFRELNTEINDELRNRNDEISLLTMEKDELLRELESKSNFIEKNASIQTNLKAEIESMKMYAEKCKENEKQGLKRLSEEKRKHEATKRELDKETDEKKDLELQLKHNREKGERWKNLSFEIKEERNKLQVQITELYRDLNEKHSNLAEEKSSLEKEIETLKQVVKRLKSNEENLRGKIEELRDEVEKLSDANSEQEMEMRKVYWEKEKLTENLLKLQSVAEENAMLQNECTETNCKNRKLKNDLDTLQEKVSNIRDENEGLQKDLNILKDQFHVSKESAHEAIQECKQLKNECTILKNNISDLTEEKERLFNENCRLKEKKNSIIQERNKLQDMIESLDKCHSDKNDSLSQQNSMLENELASRRSAIKRCEEHESKLLNNMQELNEKIENSMEENDRLTGLLKKSDGENVRLRKKVADLTTMTEQIEQERESRINLKTELNGKEQLLNKYKESKKNLNDLISTLYRQQNELKTELQNTKREVTNLSNVLEMEQNHKRKYKDTTIKLEDELKTANARALTCVDEIRNEKDQNKQLELALTKVKMEIDHLKETLERSEDENNNKIQELGSERRELLDKLEVIQNDKNEIKLCNEKLNIKIKNLEEKLTSFEKTKSQLIDKLKRKEEQLFDFSKESATLKKENKRLQEHSENIDNMLSLQNSAALDQASGMEKQINILQDTLTQLRNSGDVNRAEIDELKRKLKTANEERMDSEMKVNATRLEQKKLESEKNELINNCKRLEKLVKEGVKLKLEKEDEERLLETVQQKNRLLEEEISSQKTKLLEKDKILEDLQLEISDHTEMIENLNSAKKELITSVTELTQINDDGLKEFKLTSEKNEQLLLENSQLNELVTFQKDQIDNLKSEADEVKDELHFKIQEAENDKFQLQSDLNMRKENLHQQTEKNTKLQESLKNAKEEVDDLENENEDLLTEVDQLKEINKKAKEMLCTVQTEHSVLQGELREKENKWSEEKEKVLLDLFKMKTNITNLNDRINRANERNEKQRELEKMLRLEIDELSDGYVELEEELQHRNDENILLKEKIQTLLQNIEELELAHDTASLLKEKRQCELLKSEKDIQRLEKHLKEQQKANKKIEKEIDSAIEKEKFMELQISAEKELSCQRLKQIEDLQNSQRKVDEQLWKAKRDIEKLETEIETWRTSSDSMKVRIETLEDELNKTVDEKQMILGLYEETKKISEVKDKQIRELKSTFSEKNSCYEKIINEMVNEKSELKQKLNDHEKVLKQKSGDIKTLEELVEGISSKYEDNLLVTSILHNDIRKKDEKIADLQERKKQVTSLLADLDSKIEEIQVQAEVLETENELLRKELAMAISSDGILRQTLEEEQRKFTEKYEKSLREIEHLREIKEQFAQFALEANAKVEDKNITLLKLTADNQKLTADKECLTKTKECLQSELWEIKCKKKKLKQALDIEKKKTLKQSSDIEHLLNDCKSLKEKFSLASDERTKAENELLKADAACQEFQNTVEEKNKEILTIREDCKKLNEKSSHLEESVAVMSTRNQEHLKIKNEEIESLSTANEKLKNELCEIKSELGEQNARNKTDELEIKRLKEKFEQKQKRFHDLEVSYQNTINSKRSLEDEKNGLMTKIKTASRNLEALENIRQQLKIENEELNCLVKGKEREFEERCNAFEMAQQRFTEEIFDHKTTVENLLVDNNDLRQKVVLKSTQLNDTTKKLAESSRKLEDQDEENRRLKLEIQDLNFERNCLADVNLKVSDALGKLMIESEEVEKAQLEKGPLKSERKTSEEYGQPEYSWQSKQEFAMKSFELQNKFLLVENEIRNLRSLVYDKENQLTRLEVTLDLLRNEMDLQCDQIKKYKQKYEEENKQHRNALEMVKQLEISLKKLKDEKHSLATESQENLKRLQGDLLASKLMINDLCGKNVQLEDKIREVKESNEEKTEQIEKLENIEKTTKTELETMKKILGTTVLQIRNLEEALSICEKEFNLTNLRSDEDNSMDQYDELSSTLKYRLEQILESLEFQVEETKQLEKYLVDANTQSSIYKTELEDSRTATRNLQVKCEQLQNKLLLVKFRRDEACCKVTELSKSLITAEAKIEENRRLQKEENSIISQELQKMQRELTLACENFKGSISKTLSLEKKLEIKEKHIEQLEESLKMSDVNKRMLQIKIAELDTTTEILTSNNKELLAKEKECEEKRGSLQLSLQQEKAGRNDDIIQCSATIRKLELKNENLEQQIVRSKEILARSEKSTKEFQKKLETLRAQYKESETISNAEIADYQSKILKLQQNMQRFEEDNAQIESEICSLNKTNETLMEKISNVERENKDYRNIIKQDKQEREIQSKSLKRVFEMAFNKEVIIDSDQNKNLEKVVEIIEDLRRCKEGLIKEKEEAVKNILNLQQENGEIHIIYQAICKEHEVLKQKNSELSNLVKNIKSDLERSSGECEQLKTKIQELEENVETLHINAEQQQYQYHVLEKEKEDYENEVICIEEVMEKLSERLNESVHLLHDFYPCTTLGNLDDSGISVDENAEQLVTDPEPFDSGVFSSGFERCVVIASRSNSEAEKEGNEKVRHLETAVYACVQIMSNVGPMFKEKSMSFSIKEQTLLEEIRVLKQESDQNEDLLSSLEKEVETLELSQKSLQGTYKENDESLKETQIKLEHSITLANEKEKSIAMLNELVQEFKKKHESLEQELDISKRANEQLNREKLQGTKINQDCQKAFEEHRQQWLVNDAKNEKQATALRLRITELESQILKNENENLELQNTCGTLHAAVDEMSKQEREYLSRIASYEDKLQDLEEYRNEAQNLEKKLQKMSIDLETTLGEVTQLKEEIIFTKLERDTLKEEASVRKEELKGKKSIIEHISSELKTKDDIIRAKETKLKLIEGFLQEINKSKDCLEVDINESKRQNNALRKRIDLLKDENKLMCESVDAKEKEVTEKDDLNYELHQEITKTKNEVSSINAALNSAIDELRLSFGEAKRIKSAIEDLSKLFLSNTGFSPSESGEQDEMDTYNFMLSVNKSINNLTIACQRTLLEHESLQKTTKEQSSLLETLRYEKSTLDREQKCLKEKVTGLSRAYAEIKSSLRKEQQELQQIKNELSNEQTKNDELHNVKISLQGKIKLLEDQLLCKATLADRLKKDLADSLIKTQSQVAELSFKSDQLNLLKDKLTSTKHRMAELNNLHDETITAKEKAEKELECTQTKLADVQTSQTEQTKILNDTQVTLTQERERIVTLTKLARMKEYDLEHAKMTINLKDELIGQMKDQIEEMKANSWSNKEELVNVTNQLASVQKQQETLANEKV